MSQRPKLTPEQQASKKAERKDRIGDVAAHGVLGGIIGGSFGVPMGAAAAGIASAMGATGPMALIHGAVGLGTSILGGAALGAWSGPDPKPSRLEHFHEAAAAARQEPTKPSQKL